MRELEEENHRLKEEIARLKKIEEEYEEHKRECALVHKQLPSFVKENLPVRRNRRLGAPKGHPGYWHHTPDHIDEIKQVPLLECPSCHGALSAVQEIRSRIVEDLPPTPPPIVTQYLIERRYCKHCKQLVEADVPDALPGARFGLRVMLYVAYLKIGLAMPEQKVVQLLKSQHALVISPAEVISMLDQLRRVFGPHYALLAQKIRDAPVKGGDETGWRVDGTNHWLWTLITDEVAWYTVHRRRSYKVIQPILQDQQGKILVRDRLTTYNHLAVENNSAQQICWAHILRDSKRHAKNYDEGKTIHRRLKSIFTQAKAIAPKGTAADIERLLSRIDRFGTLRFEHKSLRTFRDSICKKHRGNLFHFVTNPAVPPTNNWSERSIRKGVIIRKISNGNRSDKGARILETLLSIIETFKLQGKNPLTGMRQLLASDG
jgi:transposase